MNPQSELSVILLAGGKSRRMGRDKREINFNSVPLIDFSLSLANEISDDILISANDSLPQFSS